MRMDAPLRIDPDFAPQSGNGPGQRQRPRVGSRCPERMVGGKYPGDAAGMPSLDLAEQERQGRESLGKGGFREE